MKVKKLTQRLTVRNFRSSPNGARSFDLYFGTAERAITVGIHRSVEIVPITLSPEEMGILNKENDGRLKDYLRAVRMDGERLNDPLLIARALGVK